MSLQRVITNEMMIFIFIMCLIEDEKLISKTKLRNPYEN